MNKHSRVCANIDLSAIMHNMEAMHQNIDPNTKIMAVIKADAACLRKHGRGLREGE